MDKLKALWNVILLAAKPLSKSADIWDLWGIIQTILTSGIWSGSSAIAFLRLHTNELGFGLLIGIPTLLIIIAAVKIQMKINSYESTTIELTYDDTCNMTLSHDNGDGSLILYQYCMVLIKSSGKVPINNVDVILKEIKPDNYGFGRISFRPRNPIDQQGRCTVYPNGIATCYFEIASWDSLSRETRFHFREQYAKTRTYPNLQNTKHDLTLLVTGERDNVAQKNEKHFVLEVDNGGIQIYPIPTSS